MTVNIIDKFLHLLYNSVYTEKAERRVEKTGKTISIFEKLALSCDSFTAGYSCLLVLFFIPYAAQYTYVAVLGVLPLACVLPFAVMPILYAVIHRADTLLFGRYHLVMPLSGFASALFFVFVWSASAVNARGACFIAFGATLFAATAPLYRYCAFSVRARLSGENVIGGSRVSAVFAAVGAATAIGAFVGFYYYDAGSAFVNTAYVLGAACILLALFQYLATYYGIPRLGGKRVQPIKTVFRTLFAGMDGRVFACVLLFDAAFFAAAALATYACVVLGLGMYTGVISAATLVVGYAAVAATLWKKPLRKRSKLYVVAFVCTFAGAALTIAALTVKLDSRIITAMLAAGAALIGAGGGAALRQTRIKLVAVKPDITSGIAFLLVELTMLAAMAIALAIGAAAVAVFVATESVYAVAGGFGVAAALSVAAVGIAAHKSVRTYRPLEVTYEPYAEITEERDARKPEQS